MPAPTSTQIDEAVPVAGTPNRAKTNAVLKALASDATMMPESGSVVRRTVETEDFTGGRVKTAAATDPEDAINKAQFDQFVTDRLLYRVNTAPETVTSPGLSGQWVADSEYIYFCISPNVWRRAILEGW